MTENEYKELSSREGFDEPKRVHFEPLSRSDMHCHDKLSFVYVVEGQFILNTADSASHYKPGDTCTLEKNVEHAEEAGPEGATILVARK